MRLVKTPPKHVAWSLGKAGGREVILGITDKGELCRVSYLRGRDPVYTVEQWQREWPRTDFTAGKTPKGWDTLPLLVVGTVFQKAVWEAVCRIPKGKVKTYGEVADEIGALRAARGVGTACKNCLIAHVIPCQRVVSSGGIGGFGGDGPEFKQELLQDEGVVISAGRRRG